MGCFNATGFFSKLPLQAGDEMVLIFCADMTRTGHKDNLPIYVAESYVPINAPIFCEYNDYGAVFEKTVVMDANAEFFEKSIGMTCERLCHLIHDFGTISIEELESIPDDEEYGKEDRKEYLKLLHALFDNAYDRWRNKIGLIWVMEHKDVYEKIAKIGGGRILDKWGRDDTDIVQKRCDAAFSILKDFPKSDGEFNLLRTDDLITKLRLETIHKMFEKDKNADYKKALDDFDKKYGNRCVDFISSSCLEEGSLSELFPTYSKILGSKEWEKYKDNFVQFFRFTRAMYAMHRVIEPSTYASQDIITDILLKTNEVIYKKAKKICKDYDKMYEEGD